MLHETVISYLSISLSIKLYICLTMYVSVCPSFYITPIYPSIPLHFKRSCLYFLFMCLCDLSICLSVNMSICCPYFLPNPSNFSNMRSLSIRYISVSAYYIYIYVRMYVYISFPISPISALPLVSLHGYPCAQAYICELINRLSYTELDVNR
jgi:hypothetical protein